MQVQQKAQDLRLPAAQQRLSRATAAIRSRVVDTVTGFLKNRQAQRSRKASAASQASSSMRQPAADALDASSAPSMGLEGAPDLYSLQGGYTAYWHEGAAVADLHKVTAMAACMQNTEASCTC